MTLLNFSTISISSLLYLLPSSLITSALTTADWVTESLGSAQTHRLRVDSSGVNVGQKSPTEKKKLRKKKWFNKQNNFSNCLSDHFMFVVNVVTFSVLISIPTVLFKSDANQRMFYFTYTQRLLYPSRTQYRSHYIFTLQQFLSAVLSPNYSQLSATSPLF